MQHTKVLDYFFFTFLFGHESFDRSQVIQKLSELHDFICSDKKILSEGVNNLFPEDSLDIRILSDVGRIRRTVEKRVKDAERKTERGREKEYSVG